ncbi:PAS domain S-box protein, partial [Arhodomonas sp. KWT]
AERVLGRSRDDLLARVIRDIEGLNDETFTEAFQRAFDLQAAVSFEARFHPPGLWLDVRAYPAPDGLTVYLRDTTERHRERRRLEFLETAVARLNDVVVITEADPSTGRGSRIVFVNEAFERVTGYSPESVLGRVTWDLLGPRISDESRARIRAALERGESAGEELLSHTRNGEPYWVELRVVPLLGPGGRPTHFVAVMRDVSDRKRAQLARERSNRALRLLSRCNRAVIRAADERRLLDTVCR